LKAQSAEIDRELEEKQAQERKLRAVIADYQKRLETAPRHESDLDELTRDYTTLLTSYQNLLARREESTIAANLERGNIGEQFRVLDPANLPERPFSPIRWQWTLAGALVGLALGVSIVGLSEYLDSSFKRGQEIERVLGLPTLALIPVISSTPVSVERRSTWKHQSIAKQ
jgi:uncharacterized protein involved in exopolysaccharide biosynthesis